MLLATPNIPVPLHTLAADGSTGLYGQARIYNSAGSLVTTISLTHTSEGLYVASYTPTTEGVYSIIYQLYTDVARTIPANFEKGMETLDVNSERTNIIRILGLVHENAVFDQQTYNGSGQLLTGRIRSYDSKTNADAAGLTGLLFTWHITASYTGAALTSYKITRDP